MRTARFSLSSLSVPPTGAAQAGLLVHIYPSPGIGRAFALKLGQNLIGRQSTDINLTDETIAPQHASITWNGQGHLLSDLGSLHGSFVNDTCIKSQLLKQGDRVRLGNQHLLYLAPGTDQSLIAEIYYKLNTTDGLTAAHNRMYFVESFTRELHMAQRSTSPLAVMLIDIDNFHAIQTSFGSIAGDQVLIDFASRVQHIVRRGDIFARLHTEQFALLCSQTQLEDALSLAERIRLSASARPSSCDSRAIPISVSIGVADFSASRSDEPNAFDAESLCTVLLAEAAQYLRQAQRQGNDRVVSCARTRRHFTC